MSSVPSDLQSAIASSPWMRFLNEHAFGKPIFNPRAYGSSEGAHYPGTKYDLRFGMSRQDGFTVGFVSHHMPSRVFYSESLLGYLVDGWPTTATDEEIVAGIRAHHQCIVDFLDDPAIQQSVPKLDAFEIQRAKKLLSALAADQPSNIAVERDASPQCGSHPSP